MKSRFRGADERNPDDALVARVRAGDRRALETLLDRHADRVHAVCRRMLGNREDALHATQEPLIASAVGARIDVDAALATLPEEFRVAVVLRDLCDLDYAEIADVLRIPPGTVRSRIARGRGALAEVLGNRDRPRERPSAQTTPTEP